MASSSTLFYGFAGSKALHCTALLGPVICVGCVAMAFVASAEAWEDGARGATFGTEAKLRQQTECLPSSSVADAGKCPELNTLQTPWILPLTIS